ncbi:hypothetical protein [Mastigocoleus testarum]|uniref:TenA family transcriptional regulator n=1 Tax=Mastigocoleus testarum BC008 TaxID=371196 RepID=A0A0V7ZKP4_9CYAN|nr:hypothetical protein [Mastigocoleus testarum]KST65161.1 hypothetical protein BC008_20395 [Mastigocoleus testarum BC008]
MKVIEDYIAPKQAQFVQHPFFEKIAKSDSLEQLTSIAQCIAFWTMTFQDILRLNEVRFTNPKLREIAQLHRIEDGGHDIWFLDDINEMNVEEPKLNVIYDVYNRNHNSTRDASYALVSEVFRAYNDYERIALLMTIETTANSFFQATADLTERVGYSSVLKYFSYYHLRVEESHESLNENIESSFDNIQLTQSEERNIFELIDRAYKAFTVMFDGLYAVLELLDKQKKLLI